MDDNTGWILLTQPAEDGHLLWTDERKNGSPVMRYREVPHSPTAVAFRIRTGRDPRGQVFAACGLQHCVAPDHVQDQTERRAARSASRPHLPGRYGHDQAEHGRYTPGGSPYCARCSYLSKHPELDDRAARPMSLAEALGDRIEQTGGCHARWIGLRNSRGNPYLSWSGRQLAPSRMVFRLHHSREPEGDVRPACPVRQCLAGPCLQDRPLRKEADRLYRAVFGPDAP
ncbi:hypothetical protein [Streptomyces sp. NPDC059893]|uniref:hypothetical protein n=1 Tax=Streptomyces sp. NPDC059893 TaxID=3346990 RepID=UPI0036510808